MPFAEIASLGCVQNATDDLLTLTTRDGERFAAPPGLAGQGLIRCPTRQGRRLRRRALQTAMTAAGSAAPPVADGLGFGTS